MNAKTLSWTAFGISLLMLCGCQAESAALVANPTFAWCGDHICSWQAIGTVKKVPTWHPDDYGVSLKGSDVVLTQLSHHNSENACLGFAIMGFVEQTAELTLELDFQDDGTVEQVEHIPASDWQTFYYVAATPDWFEDVRISLHKQGVGRAVLSRVEINTLDQCAGAQSRSTVKPAGLPCTDSVECRRGGCRMPADSTKCVSCSLNADCPGSSTCYHSPLGCEKDGTCAPGGSGAGLCVSTGNPELYECPSHTICSDCSADRDCSDGELCVQHSGYGVCEPKGSLRIGELCGRRGECDSGICENGACSECRSASDCGAGRSCLPVSSTLFRDVLAQDPWLCDPGKSARARGQACLSDSDCLSDACTNRSFRCKDGQHVCDGDYSCECEPGSMLEVNAAGTCG